MCVLLVTCTALLVTVVKAAPCGVWKHFQGGISILNKEGVRIENVNGSRVELSPLGPEEAITLDSTIYIEFQTQASYGLIFAALANSPRDMVAAYLHDGHLVFARRCGKANFFEIGKRIHPSRWYKLTYKHTSRGGTMHINGKNLYRRYQMWNCADMTSLYFGGLPASVQGRVYWEEATRQFSGCLRNVMLDNSPPQVAPFHHIVSQCERNLHG